MLQEGTYKDKYSIYSADSLEYFIEEFPGLYIAPDPDYPLNKEGSNAGTIYATSLDASGLSIYGRNRVESDPSLIQDTIGMVLYFYDSYAEHGNVSVNTIQHDYSKISVAELAFNAETDAQEPEADKGIWVERYDAAAEGRDGLKVAVYGLDELPADGTEYTYEVYLWVRDTAWGVDSLTNLEAVITPEEKAEWVSGDGQGTDITELCSSWQTAGYAARYNVYKGLAGHDDTPYVKVSIHVNRDAEAVAGPAVAVTPKED